MAQGEIEITLGERTETLRCTLRAAREINGFFGGFQNAFQRLASFDLAAYVAIVASGANKKPQDVEEAVFKAGMPNLTSPLSTYITFLANGGRDPAEVEKAAQSGES